MGIFLAALIALSQINPASAYPGLAQNLVKNVRSANDERALYEVVKRGLYDQIHSVPVSDVDERQLADALWDFQSISRRQQKGGFPEPKPGFDATQQLVSIDGEHAFVAPDFTAGDVRGPCPGLNAMANHGYLPHNGVGTSIDFIKGTFEAFGMAPDLATVLTTIGSTIDGNGDSWSIGGISKYLPSPAPGILGAPQGISGSHNKYEADVSPGRGDLYKYGNDYELQMSQFQELYDMGQAAGGHYSLATLAAFRSNRFDNSIATNPYFFNGPFSGLLVQPAAFEFIYRFMGNKSAEHPRGHLTSDVLMTFFGVHKNSQGKLVKTPGHEKIPYNWYRRNDLDLYNQNFLNLDTLTAAKNYPEFLTVGGNTGKVNTFTGVDPAMLTGGVINSSNILDGNNLACLAYEFQAQASPDLIKCSSAISNTLAATQKLEAALGTATAKLNCPAIKTFDTDQFKQFPGYTQLQCDSGTYPG